ncbi:MAG TPA: RdgB/HAM1 family non-canonical purine NTP pyrophosphatase [Pyrinomonadaceae bacterium]|nr:RdgB/HAM1 family non-canonical purine NTP pyrophosphatase [Pyrinomonadaceae bacterium]
MTRTLLIGTGNQGKLREIQKILGDVPFSLRDATGVAAPEESGDTYTANAISKAQYYADATGLWALADDSGLEVEALGGAPGVYSARYAGDGASDADRRALLISELGRSGNKSRRARFVCVVAIAAPNHEVLNVSEGFCEGEIALSERGAGGFGYDPLFIPDEYDLTFAELPEAVKNRISHRGRALAKAKQFLISSEFGSSVTDPRNHTKKTQRPVED